MTKFCLLLITLLTSMLAFGKDASYDIGNQRKIYMQCAGTGLPVVLMIAGYPERGDFAFDTLEPGMHSETVYSAVSKFTTVCIYDRPGTITVHDDTFEMSRSTPVKQPVTVNDQVKDLEALIKVSGIRKPFILLAHSAGGLIARMYAFKHPQNLLGLILLDVTTEDLKDKWGRKEWTIFDYSTNVLLDEELYQQKDLEWQDFDVSFYQLQQAMGKGKDRIKIRIPRTVVFTADKLPEVQGLVRSGRWPEWATQEIANDVMAKIKQSQDELARSFYPAAKHITRTNSGHKIQAEQPQLVVDEIRAMVQSAREGVIGR